MKKLIINSTIIGIASLGIFGCGTMSNIGAAGQQITSTGVGYVTATTEAAGTIIGRGVGVLTGYPASYQDKVVYRRDGIVYRNGYAYKIYRGKYVLVR